MCVSKAEKIFIVHHVSYCVGAYQVTMADLQIDADAANFFL